MENRINLNVDEENINIHIDETPAFTVEINPVEDVVIELNEQGPAGPRGLRGETGNGIESFELTSSSGLTDTYTITFTDGNTQSIDIENGRDAVISNVSATVNNTVGTPTVNVIAEGTPYDRSFVFEFENLKGEQGIQGIQGPVGPQGPQGPEGGTRSGMKGDYCTTYGIEYCQYGLITNPAGTKNITVKGGMMLCVPGAETKITIGSDINYTITSDGDVTIFYVDGNLLEASKVYFSIAEPIETVDGYIAWWNPDYGKWQFKSNDTGNVWRDGNATPLADIRIDNGVINRIDYIGYRVLNDYIYAIKSDVATIDLDNLTEDGEKHFLNKTQITNCLLEVPQNIKLELKDGRLTLKAGSKVIVPNGAGVFEEKTVISDATPMGTLGVGEYIIFDNGTVGGQSLRQTPTNQVFSGGTAPTKFNGGATWYNTTDNIVRTYQNNDWIGSRSFPIAKVTVTEDGIHIDQVFNGMGYIGSTIWVDKGVKCLIPNGRNTDGTLNNIEVITSKVSTNSIYTKHKFLALNTNGIAGRDTFEYNAEQNLNYFNGSNVAWRGCVIASVFKEGNNITSLQPKLPVNLVQYDEFIELKQNTLNKQQITNCITEVPQNIKLELADGVLTLKAGSKVIVPNGAGVFNEVTINTDAVCSPTGGSGECMVCVSANGNRGASSAIRNCVSGAGVTPINYGICYDTTTNIVQRWGNSVLTFEKCSLPLAIVTQTDGVITSIDKVFNGMGYIGSTVWVDKGVKTLIPDSRNEDGTLKNYEYTTTKVLTRTDSGDAQYVYGINPDGGLGALRRENYIIGGEKPQLTSGWWFDTLNNIFYNVNNGEFVKAYRAPVIIATRTNNVITSFQPKLPIRLVDWNDIQDLGKDGIGLQMFDTVIKDHILTYEESKGLALQGTYVYKEAVAGSRYGYPDFYDKCLEERNTATATQVTLGNSTITMYVASNGHQYYDIANKAVVDTFFGTMGSAWFYGVDTANERIFLPRNKYFSIGSLTEAPVVGNGIALGLNSGTVNFGMVLDNGSSHNYEIFKTGAYGASTQGTAYGNVVATPADYPIGVTTDPTKSGLVADLSKSIKPDENRYLYICVGNTESQSAITNVVDVTTTENDTVPLFTGMYFDFTPNNASWLKAGQQANSGGIYKTCYNTLVNCLNGNNPYNIKVIEANNKVAGVDYSEYWTVNQAGLSFTTPRTAGLFPNNRILVAKKEATDDDPTWYNWYSDGWCEQGGRVSSVAYNSAVKNVTFSIPMKDSAYYATAIPITDATNDGTWNLSARVAGLTTTQMTVRGGANANSAYTGMCNWEISGYASKPTVSDYTENVNLYFKVANAVQNLELLDAGEVMEAVSNIVPNNSTLISGYPMPSNRYIDLTKGASGATYTAPENGWFAIKTQVINSTGNYVSYVEHSCGGRVQCSSYGWATSGAFIPCKKGQYITLSYEANVDVQQIRFIYAEGV